MSSGMPASRSPSDFATTRSSYSSCPALCRASTSFLPIYRLGVDGRDKPGHDEFSCKRLLHRLYFLAQILRSLLRRLAQMLHQLLRRPGQRPDTAGADRKPPVGPGIADPDHGDRHRSRAAPCGGFRHHGNADIRRHQPADRVEIPQARAKPQAHAEPRGVFCNMDLQRGRIRQPDEVASGQLPEIDLVASLLAMTTIGSLPSS
jgi:hypothetical protein